MRKSYGVPRLAPSPSSAGAGVVHDGFSLRAVRKAGVPFGRWRTLLRLRAALSMLAAGQLVSRVAGRVGYDTPSAFVAAFRRETGQTPGSFFRP